MSKLTVSIKKGAEANGFNVSRDLASLISEHIEEGYIIIPRSELPEVTLCGCSPDALYMNGDCWVEGMANTPVEVALKEALERVAHWQYVDARLVKEVEKESNRNKRRDELATQFAGGTVPYENAWPSTKAAIDRIIDLEQAIA